MAFLGRCCYSRDCATIENLLGPILHAVDHIYNTVYVRSELGRETYIFRCIENIGIRCTPVRPTNEMIAFVRRCRQHHRCIGIKNTPTISSTALSRIYNDFIASYDCQHPFSCRTPRLCDSVHCQTHIAKRYREITCSSLLRSRQRKCTQHSVITFKRSSRLSIEKYQERALCLVPPILYRVPIAAFTIQDNVLDRNALRQSYRELSTRDR